MALGTYAIERDYSHYVKQASKTVLAVVGTASKGPVGEAVAITSTQDLINKFGSLKTDCFGLYAAQYFLSQASKMYFVRAASNTVSAATTKIVGQTETSTPVEDSLTLEITNMGTFSNGYTITVSENDVDGQYDLILKTATGTTIETHRGLTFDDLREYQCTNFKVTASNASTASLDPGTYTFSGGNDGIEDITSANYITAANILKMDKLDINLIAVPGISDASVISAVLTVAESRGDCLYLVDPPKGLTRDGVIQWVDGSGLYEHTAFNSSFGSLYFDWVRIYDSVNKTYVEVPPSVPVVATYAYSDRISELWYAPAGLNRGILRGVLNTMTSLTRTDAQLLYEHNINSIYEDPQVGLVIQGQKTLQRSATALDRVNVRRLLNYIKVVIIAASRYLEYEPNDRITWNSFEMKVLPVLQNIKNRRGLYDFSIVKGETIVTDDDIDNYKMPCMIMIKPIKSAEEIPIYFTLTSTGADFNEVLEANGVVND